MAMETTKSYYLPSETTCQTVAYALAEYLDLEKNMITQTMRTRNGYTVQCKGDATAEWTRYLGMEAALSIALEQNEKGILDVTIGVDKWAEKVGILVAGSIFFQPLMITAGIGAIRQAAIIQDIYRFIEKLLGSEPIVVQRTEPEVVKAAPKLEVKCEHCGTLNSIDSSFCKHCGEKLVKPVLECPECGADLDGDEAFCPYCGAKVK